MSEIIWFGVIAFLVLYFIIKICENAKRKIRTPTTKQLQKHTLKRVALKNKYHDQVPPTTPNGQSYTRIKQAYDKKGVYSKEYYEERKKLEEELKSPSTKK